MPKKKETKKPKAKKIFHPCQYCNKGLKSVQGKIIHERSCPSNPTNQEQKLESNEIAKTIPNETQKKMEEKLDPLSESALQSLEKKQQEIVSEKKDISPEEHKKMKVVLDFVQEQKDKQIVIDEKKSQIDSIKQDANLLRAQKELTELKGGGGEILDEKFQAFLFKLKAMELALGSKNSDKNDNVMITQIFQQNQQLQKQNFDMLLAQMKEAKSENNIDKFTKSFENMKKLSELVGDTETGSSAVVNKIIEHGLPPLIKFGEKAMEQKKQQNQGFPIPQNPENVSSPNIIGSEKRQVNLPASPEEVIEQAPIINPDNALSDEEYRKKYKNEMNDNGADISSPLLNMYSKMNSNPPQNKSSKMTASP